MAADTTARTDSATAAAGERAAGALAVPGAAHASDDGAAAASAAEPQGASLRRREDFLRAAARGGFFALVALLERLVSSDTRPGEAGPPSAEPIRFRHDPSLAFATHDVSSVRPTDEGRYEVTTTFLGITGAITPAPMHIAEEVLAEPDDRPLRRDFLDLFHHRLLSLLYRLVTRYDYPREYLTTVDDAWSNRVLALTGLDAWNTEVREALPRWRRLRLASLLATRARTAHTLELALADILGEEIEGARIAVEEFVGSWITLENDQRTKLGKQGSRLGMDAILGERVFDRSGKFRITIGPLSQRVYERLLSEGDLHAVIREVVALVVPDPLAYELVLVLAEGAVPPLSLGKSGGSRLGVNTWLGGRREREMRVTVEMAS